MQFDHFDIFEVTFFTCDNTISTKLCILDIFLQKKIIFQKFEFLLPFSEYVFSSLSENLPKLYQPSTRKNLPDCMPIRLYRKIEVSHFTSARRLEDQLDSLWNLVMC